MTDLPLSVMLAYCKIYLNTFIPKIVYVIRVVFKSYFLTSLVLVNYLML